MKSKSCLRILYQMQLLFHSWHLTAIAVLFVDSLLLDVLTAESWRRHRHCRTLLWPWNQTNINFLRWIPLGTWSTRILVPTSSGMTGNKIAFCTRKVGGSMNGHSKSGGLFFKCCGRGWCIWAVFCSPLLFFFFPFNPFFFLKVFCSSFVS